MTQDKMVGWHHRLNGNKFEQTPGNGKVQGSLACCRQWDCKESDMTKGQNNNDNLSKIVVRTYFIQFLNNFSSFIKKKENVFYFFFLG